MATPKNKSYTVFELDWMENVFIRLKDEVDNILDNLSDRRGPKEMPNGRVVQDAIISTKDQQLKAATDIMEKLQKMIPALEAMREKEESKSIVRGGGEVPPLMRKRP
jgi:hypothetical protein